MRPPDGNSEALATLAKENKCPLAVKADSLEKLCPTLGQTDRGRPEGPRPRFRVENAPQGLRGPDLYSPGRPHSEESFPRVSDDHLPLRDDQGSDEGRPSSPQPSSQNMRASSSSPISRARVLFPLLVERLNIYTDPQRPMMMQQGIYPVGQSDRGFSRDDHHEFFTHLLHRLRGD